MHLGSGPKLQLCSSCGLGVESTFPTIHIALVANPFMGRDRDHTGVMERHALVWYMLKNSAVKSCMSATFVT
jgi:hypothetical protein